MNRLSYIFDDDNKNLKEYFNNTWSFPHWIPKIKLKLRFFYHEDKKFNIIEYLVISMFLIDIEILSNEIISFFKPTQDKGKKCYIMSYLYFLFFLFNL